VTVLFIVVCIVDHYSLFGMQEAGTNCGCDDKRAVGGGHNPWFRN